MYKTVPCAASAEFVEKKSRFIGYVSPVKTREEADAFVEKIRSLHRTANHNVYAYTLRRDNFQRYSDDGEPGGTAGMPVLSVLLKQGLTDTALVVTRYFGGILLGAGGLVRAYSTAASNAVQQSGIVVMKECVSCLLNSDYGRYGKAAALVQEMGGVVRDTQFTDQVSIYFYLEKEKLGGLQRELLELSCGELQAQILREEFLPLPS